MFALGNSFSFLLYSVRLECGMKRASPEEYIGIDLLVQWVNFLGNILGVARFAIT